MPELSETERGLREATRTGLSAAAIKRDFENNLFYILGRFRAVATQHDHYLALAYTVRDRLLQRWIGTAQHYFEQGSRTVCYLSAEYLPGPHLGNCLLNLGIEEQTRKAMQALGLELDALVAEEPEPGLGAGGLGRLASCYLDSLASREIPAIGYGIRYEFGVFEQALADGWQVERTDKWLRLGNPWEIPRPEIGYEVKFGGYTSSYIDDQGRYRVNWVPHHVIKGVAYDTPILGYRVNTANLLRLWQSEAIEAFDVRAFNLGDYYGAVDQKLISERLTKVLYPNDEPEAGKRLRLAQEYFFVACTLRDMIRIHLQRQPDLQDFHAKYVVQLNDTHAALAIPELMRLLVDEYLLEWDQAWAITQQTFAYTNHTLLPEALETWSVDLLGQELPRHLEIIYELNRRFLDQVRRRYPDEPAKPGRLSLIGEGWHKHVRMAYLACLGSAAVNGVSALHTDLLQAQVLPDFHGMDPAKFSNKTNGVSPRRFLRLANPELSALISEAIGPGWLTELERLRELESFAEDDPFQQEWLRVKQANKTRLAALIEAECKVTVDPASLFDVQVKRFHEYKRQHLNVLHILTKYYRLKHNPEQEMAPRTFVFAGKAAPGYPMAKLMIKLINAVAELINTDPDVRERLKVVFYPNFNVKRALPMYAAADLSEQISLAGMEASGTGNMKFTLNGALTIGTLDGANVEICEAVGSENFFAFGMDATEVKRQWAQGYIPGDIYAGKEELRAVIDMLTSGLLSHGDCDLFRPLRDQLLGHDRYMLLADYCSYLNTQRQVSEASTNRRRWARMSIYNVARAGYFSSDRAVAEYCRDIWKVAPVSVPLPEVPA